MTKEEIKAIRNLNNALKLAHKLGIKICGMDESLYFATKEALKVEVYQHGYNEVAEVNVMGDIDGTGKLFSDGYIDSGGW